MRRVLSPEVMDDPALPREALEHALEGLARLNRVSYAFQRTIGAVARLAADRPCRILDVACARGDFALAAARFARDRGLPWRVCGCDINPHAIAEAASRAKARRLDAEFFTLDVLDGEWPATCDIAVCSLFLHHLTREQAEKLLASMARCSGAIIVNDLVRSPFNLAAVGVASRLLTRSPVVHTDAVLSARAAWTRAEFREMAARVGLEGATITSGGIARMMLVWRRSA